MRSGTSLLEWNSLEATAMGKLLVLIGLALAALGLLMMIVQCARRSHRGSPLADIVEGFRWVNQTKIIRALLLLLGLVSLVGLIPSRASHQR